MKMTVIGYVFPKLEKEKFSEFFAAFLKCISNFEHFE